MHVSLINLVLVDELTKNILWHFKIDQFRVLDNYVAWSRSFKKEAKPLKVI